MKILGYTFSPGNSKIGKIWNFSLPPGKACPKGVPCFSSKGCYAHKAYRMYPGVRKAWEQNYNKLITDDLSSGRPDLMAAVTRCFVMTKIPKYFRIHVAGDFISQEYLDTWDNIASIHYEVKFLAFTKNFFLNYENLEKNFKVVFSMWPGWDPGVQVSNSWESLPKAWVYDRKNPDIRIPENAFKCPGSCIRCKHCWNNLSGDVVFTKH